MKTVTRYTHPSADSALILEGTPEQTRIEALQYFPDDQDLAGKEEQMSDDDFYNLREFEG
jgi:hypothetical protein